MDHPEVSDGIRALLIHRVDTLEKLELVSLLSRHPVGWTAITAGEQLGIPSAVAGAALEELRLAEVLLLEPGAGYQCRPAEELAPAVKELVEIYDNDRVAILTVLAKTALERIRSSAAHTFADAFRLRGKKKGDPDG